MRKQSHFELPALLKRSEETRSELLKYQEGVSVRYLKFYGEGLRLLLSQIAIRLNFTHYEDKVPQIS